jgi:dipeptidyl aminopeptidase/acylaminoacyl peptidase
VRLLHGLLDREVPSETSLKLATSLESDNVTVTFIKNGDHRLSNLESLSCIFLTVAELLSPPPREIAAND